MSFTPETPAPSALMKAFAAADASAARCEVLTAQIEALTGKEVSVIRHIGRLSDSRIASFIDADGSEVGFHADTAEQALSGLLEYALRASPSINTQAA